MDYIDISIDCETWGTTPGCDVRSVGAIVWSAEQGMVASPCQTCKGGTVAGNIDPMSGDCSDCLNTRLDSGWGSTFYTALDNPYQGGGLRIRGGYQWPLTRDGNTVKWWAGQSAEAQAAFTDPVPLATGLRNLSHWLEEVTGPAFGSPAVRLWAHGPHFDLPILEAAYRACGLPVPWHYRSARDTRTLFDLCGITDHSAWLAKHPGPLGVPHHAQDDAICQARAMVAALRVRG